MMRILPMTLFLWAASFCHGQIVLTEVMFDPDGSEHANEFIEIYNIGTSGEVDLTGWKIGDGSGEDGITDTGEGLIMAPKQFGLILDPDYFENSTQYDYIIPDDALVLTIDGATLGSGGLSNSQAETVTLYDPAHEIVCQYVYSTGNPSGHSDEKIDLPGSDAQDNWMDSAVFNGTPGFRNSVTSPDSSRDVRLSISPNPFSPDDDCYDDAAIITYHFASSPSHVNLRIFDMRGRCIRNLMGAALSGYDGQIIWDGRDDRGQMAGIGIYIVHIEGLSAMQGKTGSARATVVLAGRL
jgi:hypothetical protein